eukprot:14210-Heterococcus_DN1.PRE.1
MLTPALTPLTAYKYLKLMLCRATMVNYNPETVSTDYDECDQLYFEELSRERVMDICEQSCQLVASSACTATADAVAATNVSTAVIHTVNIRCSILTTCYRYCRHCRYHEAITGVVVSVGGQIPQNLALPLEAAGKPILGTAPSMIDRAEDRHKFSAMVDEIGLEQACAIYSKRLLLLVLCETQTASPALLTRWLAPRKLMQRQSNCVLSYTQPFGTTTAVLEFSLSLDDSNKSNHIPHTINSSSAAWEELTSLAAAQEFAEKVGFPVLIRPSYVLSGAAMNVAHNALQLIRCLTEAAESYHQPLVVLNGHRCVHASTTMCHCTAVLCAQLQCASITACIQGCSTQARVILRALAVSKEHPVVVSKFIHGAREVEMDAVALGLLFECSLSNMQATRQQGPQLFLSVHCNSRLDTNGEVVAAATHIHVENAGVHSGDATLILPPGPEDLSTYSFHRVQAATAALAKALQVTGPFNIQFLVKGTKCMVIECNLRASRSFPFVSKTMGVDFIEAATRVMVRHKLNYANKAVLLHDVGADVSHMNLPKLWETGRPKGYVGCKAPIVSVFCGVAHDQRRSGADPVLGVEMASTGEVACFGATKQEAFLKALLSTGFKMPEKGILFSAQETMLDAVTHAAFELGRLGFKLYATQGTHTYLAAAGVETTLLHFPSTGESPSVLDALRTRSVDLVVNLPTSESVMLADNYTIRRTAVDLNIPLLTNLNLVRLFADAMG